MKALDVFKIDPKAVRAALFSNALIKGDYRIIWKKKITVGCHCHAEMFLCSSVPGLTLRMAHPLSYFSLSQCHGIDIYPDNSVQRRASLPPAVPRQENFGELWAQLFGNYHGKANG